MPIVTRHIDSDPSGKIGLALAAELARDGDAVARATAMAERATGRLATVRTEDGEDFDFVRIEERQAQRREPGAPKFEGGLVAGYKVGRDLKLSAYDFSGILHSHSVAHSMAPKKDDFSKGRIISRAELVDTNENEDIDAEDLYRRADIDSHEEDIDGEFPEAMPSPLFRLKSFFIAIKNIFQRGVIIAIVNPSAYAGKFIGLYIITPIKDLFKRDVQTAEAPQARARDAQEAVQAEARAEAENEAKVRADAGDPEIADGKAEAALEEPGYFEALMPNQLYKKTVSALMEKIVLAIIEKNLKDEEIQLEDLIAKLLEKSPGAFTFYQLMGKKAISNQYGNPTINLKRIATDVYADIDKILVETLGQKKADEIKVDLAHTVISSYINALGWEAYDKRMESLFGKNTWTATFSTPIVETFRTLIRRNIVEEPEYNSHVLSEAIKGQPDLYLLFIVQKMPEAVHGKLINAVLKNLPEAQVRNQAS